MGTYETFDQSKNEYDLIDKKMRKKTKISHRILAEKVDLSGSCWCIIARLNIRSSFRSWNLQTLINRAGGMTIAPGGESTIHVEYHIAIRICLCRAPRLGIVTRLTKWKRCAASHSLAKEYKREAAFRVWIRSRRGGAGGDGRRWCWKAWKKTSKSRKLDRSKCFSVEPIKWVQEMDERESGQIVLERKFNVPILIRIFNKQCKKTAVLTMGIDFLSMTMV